MTFEELQSRLAANEDVTEEEAMEILASPDLEKRVIARTAVARTSLRRALIDTQRLAAEQHYSDQGTLAAIARLATMSDVQEPYIETLKQLGLHAARQGQLDAALGYLQEAVNRAVAAGQQRDARSRRAMRYLHDDEIDRALDALAQRFERVPGRISRDEPLRLTLFCSALQDEDGPTVITYKRAIQFREAGFDVEIVSTEMASSANSKIAAKIRSLGFGFFPAAGQNYTERLDWLLKHFRSRPANAVSSTVSTADLLGKLVGCIGVAPVQAWDNRGVEPQTGKYDLVYQGISPEQETKTAWPGKSKYYGSSVAMAEEIDAAEPLLRAEVGVPDDAVLLATFGRMEKCAKPEYMEALARILSAEERAWLVLAGRDAFGAVGTMQAFFTSRGVWNKVRYLGPRQQDGPRLLKTVDVYCETYPWPGGQSLMDAMYAGLPIVAMRRADDPDLDPTGCGSTTAVADVLLDGLVDIADAGDVDGYVRIARRYVSDAALRRAAGQRLREKAVRECNMREKTVRYGEDIRALLQAKAALEAAPR
jgi:tetratricopeptide (TPR) repeat protein